MRMRPRRQRRSVCHPVHDVTPEAPVPAWRQERGHERVDAHHDAASHTHNSTQQHTTSLSLLNNTQGKPRCLITLPGGGQGACRALPPATQSPQHRAEHVPPGTAGSIAELEPTRRESIRTAKFVCSGPGFKCFASRWLSRS